MTRTLLSILIIAVLIISLWAVVYSAEKWESEQASIVGRRVVANGDTLKIIDYNANTNDYATSGCIRLSNDYVHKHLIQ